MLDFRPLYQLDGIATCMPKAELVLPAAELVLPAGEFHMCSWLKGLTFM
jgi:hypothetical protein